MEFIQRSERWLSLDNLENEIWKDVVGYENLYEVSNYGRVRTHENKTTSSARFKERHWKQRILKQKFQKRKRSELFDGRVILWKDGKEKTFLVSRLVCIAFVPNPDNLPEVNHIDGNPLNNNVNNLEWCTSKYNVNHAIDNDLNIKNRKKIKVINKTTKEEFIFRSMNEASEFIGKSKMYISVLTRNHNKFENEDWIWEILKS